MCGPLMAYTQKNIQIIEKVQKSFFTFAGYVLKISHPPHNYISEVSEFLNLSNFKIILKILDIRFINDLVPVKIKATRLLGRITFHILRSESRNN